MAADVIVVGGGPAGSAAALTLARHTELAVTVLERGAYRQERIGEALSPGVMPLLEYLGVAGAFRTAGFRPGHAFTAAWGDATVHSRDFLFTPAGEGWHLDRRRFDWGLAHAAEAAGAVLHLDSAVRRVARAGDLWQLTIDGPEGRRHLSARFLIDAAGRPAPVGRAAGARVVAADRLVGAAAMLTPASAPPSTVLVEAVADGWWYTAPLPDGRLVAAVMTDADVAHARGLADPEAWAAALRAAPHSAARAAGAAAAPVRIWPARSQWLDPPCGSGWAAAGDAAAAFDPLSSLGIGYALTSGIEAARVAAATLDAGDGDGDGDGGADGGRSQAAAYAAGIAGHIADYTRRHAAIHALERRFPASVFWQRRTGAIPAAPPTPARTAGGNPSPRR